VGDTTLITDIVQGFFCRIFLNYNKKEIKQIESRQFRKNLATKNGAVRSTAVPEFVYFKPAVLNKTR
jgi:hypothetical protein